MHVLSTHPAPMLRQLYFSSLNVVLRAFSVHVRALHVFDIRASSSLLGYLCAKFRFCHTHAAELAHGEKSVLSLTHPAYLICLEPKLIALEFMFFECCLY